MALSSADPHHRHAIGCCQQTTIENGLEGGIFLRLDNAMHTCHTDIALVPGCNRRVQKLNCPMHANRMDPDPKDIGARDLRIVTASGHKKHRCLLLLSVLDNVGHFSSLCSWVCNPTLACLEVETRSRSCNQTARLFGSENSPRRTAQSRSRVTMLLNAES